MMRRGSGGYLAGSIVPECEQLVLAVSSNQGRFSDQLRKCLRESADVSTVRSDFATPWNGITWEAAGLDLFDRGVVR